MSRPVHIGAALRRKLDEKGIKTLDHADRIGIGMIGRQHRKAVALLASGLSHEHACALVPEIADKSGQAYTGIITWIKCEYGQAAGNKGNRSMAELGSTECLGVEFTGLL